MQSRAEAVRKEEVQGSLRHIIIKARAHTHTDAHARTYTCTRTDTEIT